MCTTGAGQSRNAFFVRAHLYAEEIRDDLIGILGIDGAQARIDVALHQFFGERSATRRATGTAVGFRQQILDVVDTWIFEYEQPTVRNNEDRCQDDSQHRHECHRNADKLQRTHYQVLTQDPARAGLVYSCTACGRLRCRSGKGVPDGTMARTRGFEPLPAVASDDSDRDNLACISVYYYFLNRKWLYINDGH